MDPIHDERDRKMFEKIRLDYVNGEGSIEKCCNKNGVCKQTYYNIKKRIDNEQTTEKTIAKPKIKTKNIDKKKSLFTTFPSSREVIDKMEIEFITTPDEKSSRKKKHHRKIIEDNGLPERDRNKIMTAQEKEKYINDVLKYHKK